MRFKSFVFVSCLIPFIATATEFNLDNVSFKMTGQYTQMANAQKSKFWTYIRDDLKCKAVIKIIHKKDDPQRIVLDTLDVVKNYILKQGGQATFIDGAVDFYHNSYNVDIWAHAFIWDKNLYQRTILNVLNAFKDETHLIILHWGDDNNDSLTCFSDFVDLKLSTQIKNTYYYFNFK